MHAGIAVSAVPRYWPLVEAVAGCLCTLLPDTIGGEVGRCCPIPGNQVILDDCCQGTAWVRVARVDAVTAEVAGAAPAIPRDWGGGSCGPLLATVVLGIGVMRCASGMDEAGVPPTCEELTFETQRMTSDIDAIYAAALCCQSDVEVYSAAPISLTPAGPAGGCVGAELLASYIMDLCPCAFTDGS